MASWHEPAEPEPLSYVADFALHRESCGLGEADEPDHTYYADALVCKPDAEARRWEDE